MSKSGLDMTRVVSAPGKIVLAGEYAVLEGASAVTVAVNRRVRARLVDPPPKPLAPVIGAVREEMAESTAFAGISRAALDAIRRVVVDSSELYTDDGESKLGFGSSAATTVVAAACALSARSVGDGESEIPTTLVHRLAHRSHASFQKQRGHGGSGIDIAACTFGGVLVTTVSGPGQPVEYRSVAWPDNAHLVYTFTGRPADTPTLVEKIRTLRIGDRRAYERSINRIADASAATIDALERADAAALIAAIDAGGEAVDALGTAASAALTIDAHRRMLTLAREFSGSAKPTGAGGGDVAVAVFSSADQARAFAAKAEAEGLLVLGDVAIAQTGVTID